MQEADAARRLAILRGETPPPLPDPEPGIDPSDRKFARRDKDSATGFSSRKRKRTGEDDTDFEMRLARERAEAGRKIAADISGGSRAGEAATKGAEVQIVDGRGHIDLVGAPPPSSGKEKNDEYEREKERKKRELEDQYTMRFSNATGRDGFAAGDPWYAKSDSRSRTAAASTKEERAAEVGSEATSKNVWGNDDPKRKERETQRLASNDPLAMMKVGAKKVREIEKERRKYNEEKEQELRDLRREERREERRRRRDRHDREGSDSRHRHRHRSHRSEHSERRHENGIEEERKSHHRQRHRDEKCDNSREKHRVSDRDIERERGEGRSRRSDGDAGERRQHR